jgi:spermidine synthase
MNHTPRLRLLLASALALFVELALIRYFGSEIRIFSYYKNLVLIACFLGFGVGFYRAAAKPRLGVSLAVMALSVSVVSVGVGMGWTYGPTAATDALSNYAGTLTMGEQQVLESSNTMLISGFAWALALFVACLITMYGFAQRIGADIDSFPASRRLEAYSFNVGGSLLGIAAFSLVSWLAIGPGFWFGTALCLAAPLLPPSRPSRWIALAAAPVLGFALFNAPDTIWSPYQRLTVRKLGDNHWMVLVNGTGYMSLESFERSDPTAIDRWRLPHTIQPNAKTVLIIGAGGGNDVSAALHAGAERVVAVEIDPEILKIGRKLHPDAPYADPRVQVVVDDARHYGETTSERFDLIVFSHLDSHTALSGFTNVRLDNYIYTVESFRTFQRLLKPTGSLYVSFFSTRRWVAERLRDNLRIAFGRAPVALFTPVSTLALQLEEKVLRRVFVLNAHFVATADAGARASAERIRKQYFAEPESAATPPSSTDDWPYLFVEDHHIPTPMLMLALMLGGVSALFVAFHVRRELHVGGGWPIDRHYFFLGAGFLLVEVHNVGKLARVFGTTWSVNAWVIATVLGVILVANVIVQRWPDRVDARVAYVALILCLLACARLPIETVLAWPFAHVLVTVLYTLPLLFAGMIFAQSFRSARYPMRALGSNLLGALLGGYLELASFVVGLAALLYVAVLLYALSYPLQRSPATSSAPAHA